MSEKQDFKETAEKSAPTKEKKEKKGKKKGKFKFEDNGMAF